MKKIVFRNHPFILFLIGISFSNFECHKDSTDKFCEVPRTSYVAVINKEGMVVFSNKYDRYALSLTVTTPNNIDTQIIGFVCGLDENLKTIGLKIAVSGTLRSFNSDENMTPEIAGQELYFLEVSQITRKQ